MLMETGQVVAIDPDGLWIQTEKQSTCAKCSARHGCGHRLLSAASSDFSIIKALFRSNDSNSQWAVGDMAAIGIEESALVKGALLVYLVPLALLISMVLIAAQFKLSDGVQALFALVGLIVGGLIVWLHAQMIRKRNNDCSTYNYHAFVMSKVIREVKLDNR